MAVVDESAVSPTCQVAGIGNTDTVILDECRAACIKWDKFELVVTKIKPSFSRKLAAFTVRSSPIMSKSSQAS